MSPSLPSNPSLPSLTDMTSAANEKESLTPVTSGTTSPASSSSSSDHSDSHSPSFLENTLLEKSLLGEAAVANAAADAANAAKSGTWYYYLSPAAAERLPRYRYQGEDQSPLYRHVLSPLAGWCVDNLTPAWLAPNAITLLGLGWMVLSYLVIWYWCPGLYEANTDLGAAPGYAVPSVIFLLNGCAMLIYQTLDNMDGKQARKTGSSSPLGLLFDHGCDALNTIFGSANWIAAMAMVPGNVSDLLGSDDHDNVQRRSLLSEFFGGDAVLAALLILCPMVAFYFSMWEQYYTGKLILPPFNGPSEGLICGATLSIVSFFWGPMYWQSTTWADGAIDRLGFESLRGRVRNLDLIVFAAVAGLAQEIILRTTFVVRTHGLRTLRTTVPQVLLAVSALAMVHFDPTMFLQRPRIAMHLISGLFVEQTAQFMLDHMVEEEFELRGRWPLFPLVSLAAMMAMGVSFPADILDLFLSGYATALWFYLAFKISIQLFEICDVLEIWCFDIVTPHPKKLSRAGGEVGGTTVPGVDGTTKKTN